MDMDVGSKIMHRYRPLTDKDAYQGWMHGHGPFPDKDAYQGWMHGCGFRIEDNASIWTFY